MLEHTIRLFNQALKALETSDDDRCPARADDDVVTPRRDRENLCPFAKPSVDAGQLTQKGRVILIKPISIRSAILIGSYEKRLMFLIAR